MKALALLLLAACLPLAAAEPDASTLSAKELAGQLNTLRQDGTSLVRLRLQVKQPAQTLQLQITERRLRGGGDAIYQILWPKERTKEAVILHAGGKGASATIVHPPNKPRTISGSQMGEGIFGSDLSYQDCIENFFAWSNQAVAGNEPVGRVNCIVLESKPGSDDHTIYTSVKSWIDPKRMVPLRVEKYAGGKLVRRIETTKVASDDRGKSIPADLSVQHGSSTTDLDGSKIRHDIFLTDHDFTPAGLAEGAKGE